MGLDLGIVEFTKKELAIFIADMWRVENCEEKSEEGEASKEESISGLFAVKDDIAYWRNRYDILEVFLKILLKGSKDSRATFASGGVFRISPKQVLKAIEGIKKEGLYDKQFFYGEKLWRKQSLKDLKKLKQKMKAELKHPTNKEFFFWF